MSPKIGIVVINAMFLATAIGVAFSPVMPVGFWVFVEKYQTLITGLAAVGAAVATVRQMQKSDRKSDDRHDALMKLSVRADALIVDRAVSPQVTEMPKILAVVEAIRRAFDDETKLIQSLKNGSEDLILNYRQVQQFISNSALGEAVKLFDGDIANSYHLIQEASRDNAQGAALTEIYASSRYVFGETSDERIAREKREDHEGNVAKIYNKHVEISRQNAVILDKHVKKFFDGLLRLKREYGV